MIYFCLQIVEDTLEEELSERRAKKKKQEEEEAAKKAADAAAAEEARKAAAEVNAQVTAVRLFYNFFLNWSFKQLPLCDTKRNHFDS